MDQPFYVYMVQCKNGAIYTGIALNVQNRINQHNNKKGSKSVIAHGLPVKLLCQIKQKNKSQALKLESKIKKLTRNQKLELIKQRILLCQLRIVLKKQINSY